MVAQSVVMYLLLDIMVVMMMMMMWMLLQPTEPNPLHPLKPTKDLASQALPRNGGDCQIRYAVFDKRHSTRPTLTM